MQLHLPIFRKKAWLINDHTGVYEKDRIIQYIVSGIPIYSHSKNDIYTFRFITSNFFSQDLCRNVDIERFFYISEDSVYRFYKKFIEQGEQGYFGNDARKGKAHEITSERRLKIQTKERRKSELGLCLRADDH